MPRRAKRHEGEGNKRDERHIVCHRHACEEDDSHKRERNARWDFARETSHFPIESRTPREPKPGNDSH